MNVLQVTSVTDLARVLRRQPRELHRIAERLDEHVQHFELHDPSRPDKKPRVVLSPCGPYRKLQRDLLNLLFRPRLLPSPYSYGGVPGRSAVGNARLHVESQFAFTTDIENFFPSITFWQVHATFAKRLGCPPDVSMLLSKLCTYHNHLAQGLITSPILADHAVRGVDVRIGGVAAQHDLAYSRFVDDITISGRFRLDGQTSGIVDLVRRIIEHEGFTLAQTKEQSGRLPNGEIVICGLRQRRGHLDVEAEYIQRLELQLESHRLLGLGQAFNEPLMTQDQLRGRVEYVCAVNRRRRPMLRQKLTSIDWIAVRANAEARGLMVCRKVMRPVSE